MLKIDIVTFAPLTSEEIMRVTALGHLTTTLTREALNFRQTRGYRKMARQQVTEGDWTIHQSQTDLGVIEERGVLIVQLPHHSLQRGSTLLAREVAAGMLRRAMLKRQVPAEPTAVERARQYLGYQASHERAFDPSIDQWLAKLNRGMLLGIAQLPLFPPLEITHYDCHVMVTSVLIGVRYKLHPAPVAEGNTFEP